MHITPTPAVPGDKPRSRWMLIPYRFFASLLLLIAFPFPLDLIPLIPLDRYYGGWDWLVRLTATNLFGMELTVMPGGSGDTTYNYVFILVALILSTIVTATWTLLSGPERPSRAPLFIRAYLRFNLAYWMITYGAIKVIKSQFPDPSLGRLIQPFGDASPMGLLWTMMGASASYNIFTGGLELLAGALLMFRRTATAGALVATGTVANILALNLSYDVPVKLFTSQLLLMSLFLLSWHLVPLTSFLFRGLAAEAPVSPPIAGTKRGWLITVVLTTLSLFGMMYLSFNRAADGRAQQQASKSPMEGIWSAEIFQSDGRIIPPIFTEHDRWRRVVFEGREVSIHRVDDRRQRYRATFDVKTGALALARRELPTDTTTLQLVRNGAQIILSGPIDGHTIKAVLSREPDRQFPLMTRGFHWISEYGYNR